MIEFTEEGLVDHQYGYAELLARRAEDVPLAIGRLVRSSLGESSASNHDRQKRINFSRLSREAS